MRLGNEHVALWQVTMEGYLEVRTSKMLQINKKFWFVLTSDRLNYYTNKWVGFFLKQRKE